MPAASLLRTSFHTLGLTEALHRACNPVVLADKAHVAEMAAGVILNPRHAERTTYLPYAAARPVAAWSQGARKAGFLASAYWGASVTTSLLRSDGPALSLYYHVYLHNHAPQAPVRPEARAGRRTDGLKAALQTLKTVALTAPIALCASETFFGTGALVDEPTPLGAGELFEAATLERLRGIGCGGFLESRLLNRADATTGLAALCFEAAALGVRLLMVPGRIVNGAILAATALVGAGVGVLYESVAQLSFAVQHARLSRQGVARVVPTAGVQQQQEAQNLAGLRMLDDTQLPAPLIRALWLPVHPGLAHNRWTAAGAAGAQHWRLRMRDAALVGGAVGDNPLFAATAAYIALRAYMGQHPEPHNQAAFAPLPQMPGAFPAAAQGQAMEGAQAAADVARAAQAGVDVHAAGRDPATRRAVARLFELYADVDEAVNIEGLLQWLDREQRALGALERRRHETGVSVIEAAKRALDPHAAENMGGFCAILSPGPGHGILLDDGSRMPVKRVCATVWHAIARLKEGNGGDEQRNLRLQEERQEAFVIAVADVVNPYNARVCAAGQVQRMVLVLQGCLEGIEVENYERVPSVAQMVSYLYQQLATDLPDDASPQQVETRFNRAYEEGIRRLPEPQHAAFRQELSALALMDYDVGWAPRAVAA